MTQPVLSNQNIIEFIANENLQLRKSNKYGTDALYQQSQRLEKKLVEINLTLKFGYLLIILCTGLILKYV
jgi:hypothetical protein